MGYLRRQMITAALTANALRPARSVRAGIPSFAAGWLTSELAPHLLALTAADTAVHLARGRRSPLGVALAAASAVGLGSIVRESQRAQDRVESALVDGIGADYVEQLDALPSPADLATPWRSLVNPFAMRDKQIERVRNISFGPAGKRNVLDLYLPSEIGAEPAPVLLQVHGGAWTIGNKDQQGIPLMQHMARRGWICVAINYRLSPRDAFPAHIIDVKRAIAWIRENIAEYGGDPRYLAITGGSAGGHLAALAAVTANDPAFQPGFEDIDTTIQVAVPHYGFYDIAASTGLASSRTVRDSFLAKRVFQTSWSQDPQAFEEADPILRVTPDAPDFFVIHGSNDTLVPVEQGRQFVRRLREVSRRSVVYAELPGTQHAFDVFPSIRGAHVVRAVDRYLTWHWNSWRTGRRTVPQAETSAR
ncbi:alpha/beta hydrolase [Nocardioides daejeonensis]|uniref:alpha/beta hydrolase n=1 Tax=Nocardioides daejeonensis TaxID=1046556 RepID=UPI00195280EE|nr:alpha/beta hydrolase [Nocardioides daejeonensis]